MKRVFKVVREQRGGYWSFNRGFGPRDETEEMPIRKRYPVGVNVKPDYGFLYAFDLKENAVKFVNQYAPPLGVNYVVFTADAVTTRRTPFIYGLIKSYPLHDVWQRLLLQQFNNWEPAPKGTILCRSIKILEPIYTI